MRASLSEEVLTQPHLRISQPGRLVRWLPICLMSFTCSSSQWLSRKSELGVCTVRTRTCRPKSPGSGSSLRLMASKHPGFYPHSSWKQLLHILKTVQPLCWFSIFRDAQGPRSSPRPVCRKRGPGLKNHITAAETDTQEKVGVGIPQKHADSVVDCGLHLLWNTLSNLRAHG